LADKPTDTVRELKELVVVYAKQETLEPLKGTWRYVRNGIAGAFLMGLGVLFVAIGALRALQTQTGEHFTNNWSFVPYVIVIAGLFIVAALAGYGAVTKKDKKADE
jgi:hypothetical protein